MPNIDNRQVNDELKNAKIAANGFQDDVHKPNQPAASPLIISHYIGVDMTQSMHIVKEEEKEEKKELILEVTQPAEQECRAQDAKSLANVPLLESSNTMEPRSNQMLSIESKREEEKRKATVKTQESSLETGVEPVKQITLPEGAVYIRRRHQLYHNVEDVPYFHGYMNKEDGEKTVREEGQFVLRKVPLQTTEYFMLTVRWKSGFHHVRVWNTSHETWFWITKYLFKSVYDLIDYHLLHKHPVILQEKDVSPDNIFLSKGVPRACWQLTHAQIAVGKLLGKGAFGEVFEGIFRTGIFREKKCAVKTIQAKGSTPKDKEEFLREAYVMLSLHHRHTVKLYGVASLRSPIMIVMELADGGSLLQRLREDPPLESKLKLRYTGEILRGMAYLEKVEIIHRDLAARNILLDNLGKCKISDFGLSLKGKIHRQRRLCKVPIRWLSPETMGQGVFTSKTDVWSYGVTVWEMFSDGLPPYGHIPELKNVRLGVLFENLRLTPPKDTPISATSLMEDCFIFDSEMRPSFAQLKKYFAYGGYQKRCENVPEQKSRYFLSNLFGLKKKCSSSEEDSESLPNDVEAQQTSTVVSTAA